jgi:hypothetical protein
MTKKHFEDLAKLLGEIRAHAIHDKNATVPGLYGHIEIELVKFCQKHNDEFSYKKFEKACESSYNYYLHR